MKKLAYFLMVGAVATPAFAQGTDLQQALQPFQRGEYLQSLDLLGHLKPSPAVHYWIGASESKLQRFDSAIQHLRAALLKGSDKLPPDASYLLGQAEYSVQDFKTARGAFEASIKRGYKPDASLYYIGYIDLISGNTARALTSFQSILAKSDSEMKQPAQFQIGEAYLKTALETKDEARKKALLKQSAIPAYEATIQIDSENPLSIQSSGRLREIGALMKEEVAHTKSGVTRPAKPWVIRLSESIKYDTNLINQPDETLVKVSHTASPLNQTSAFGKYEYLVDNWVAITPELQSDYTFNWRRAPEVYANDAINVDPAIRTRWDHRVNGKPAAALLEYKFAFQARDYREKNSLNYFYLSNHFTLGERFEIFEPGSTTLRADVRLYQNADVNQNYIGPGGSISQNWKVAKNIVNTTLTFEDQRANNPFYDQRNYGLLASYGIPNFYFDTSIDFNFNFLLIDTENQSPTRGTEKNLSPGLVVTKFFDRSFHWTGTFTYNYTDYISQDKADYAYTKHVFGFGVQYTF